MVAGVATWWERIERSGGTGVREPQVGDRYLVAAREPNPDPETGDRGQVLAEVVAVGAPVSGWYVHLREVAEAAVRASRGLYVYIERDGRLRFAMPLVNNSRVLLVDTHGQLPDDPIVIGAPASATEADIELLRRANATYGLPNNE